MNEMVADAESALSRILVQAEKALDDVPFETPVGIYGLSIKEMRLGNIIAIARTALTLEKP